MSLEIQQNFACCSKFKKISLNHSKTNAHVTPIGNWTRLSIVYETKEFKETL